MLLTGHVKGGNRSVWHNAELKWQAKVPKLRQPNTESAGDLGYYYGELTFWKTEVNYNFDTYTN